MNKPRVIIVDVRHGQVKADGSNIDLPPEGQESALRSLETGDVIVEVHEDGLFVKEGSNKGWVTMFTTKSEAQLSAEKAARELQHRVGDKPDDDVANAEAPTTRLGRCFGNDFLPSGEPVDGGLKGY